LLCFIELRLASGIHRQQRVTGSDGIAALCREPKCFEQILQALFAEYQLVMNFEQYALVGSTVKSYLTWLKETGRVEAVFEDNRLLWKTI
jgi:hypothetical protein